MAFGDNLKKYREEKGITQKELSEKIGKSMRSISYYETAAKTSLPDSDTLELISDVLGVPISTLLDLEEHTSQEEQLLNLLEGKTLKGEIVWYSLAKDYDELTNTPYDLEYPYFANPNSIISFYRHYKPDFTKHEAYYTLYGRSNYFLTNVTESNKMSLIVAGEKDSIYINLKEPKDIFAANSLLKTIKSVISKDYTRTLYELINELSEE